MDRVLAFLAQNEEPQGYGNIASHADAPGVDFRAMERAGWILHHSRAVQDSQGRWVSGYSITAKGRARLALSVPRAGKKIPCPLTPAELARLPLATVAEEQGVSTATVSRWRREAGIRLGGGRR